MSAATLTSGVGQFTRSTAGLVRSELNSALRLAAGLLVPALLGLVFARTVLRVHMPWGEGAHLNVLCAFGVLLAIPVIAGAFEGRGRMGAFLRSSPVTKSQVFGAKVMGALLAVLACVIAMLIFDAAIALAAPAGLQGPISDALAWEGFRTAALGLGGLALAATFYFSIVIRSAFGACLAGGLVGAAPVALVSAKFEGVAGVFLRPMVTLVNLPGAWVWGPAALLIALGVMFPLRGAAARSLLRRCVLPAIGLGGLLTVPWAVRVLEVWRAPAPAFAAPTDAVYDCEVSPDGTRILVQLGHAHASRAGSLWLVDAETFEVERLPDPIGPMKALQRRDIASATWSSDGSAIYGWIRGTNDHLFAIDVDSRELSRLRAQEFAGMVPPGGWSIVPGEHPGAEYDVSGPGFISATLHARSRPRPASRRPWLLFFSDVDGTVCRYDGRSGETLVTGLTHDVLRPTLIRTSPRGEWIVGRSGRSGSVLFHVETGRSREFTGYARAVSDRERPLLLVRDDPEGWVQWGLDGESPFLLPCRNALLEDIDGDRWLATTVDSGIHVLDARGALIHTIRSGKEEAR